MLTNYNSYIVIVKDAKSFFTNQSENSNNEFERKDIAKTAFENYKAVLREQRSFDCLRNCVIPVICAIDGPCIGGGVDIICGADIRYCTKDSYFSIKEIDVALTAGIGTFARIIK